MLIVRAHSNIALIKYWGKRSEPLRLPCNGSLSLTLDKLYTDTSLNFVDGLRADTLTLNGALATDGILARVRRFMDLVRGRYGLSDYAAIESINHFPTGAGLASSASGFAALALAATAAAGLKLSATELSILARLGSGSACRSIFAGFAEWLPGTAADGSDSYAVTFETDFAPSMAVLILAPGPKPTSSGDGMARTVETSPLYAGWQQAVNADLKAIKLALAAQDLEAVGTIMERNALTMHATALAAQPAVLYWLPQTVALIHHVRELRAQGHPCWLTIDAGPNLKVLLPPLAETHATATLKALREHPAVQDLILCRPGPAAHVLAETP
ncbi:MAG: diphosphomevalonate decarboxylase [Candidatus Melainabacteria bacterium HGW-Melainabacteria-1]|nr:MAG: diphosphomevalonate decarboxylase [Candidatus Melainabacteria bacterium HGW-Melainabacteria-1]